MTSLEGKTAKRGECQISAKEDFMWGWLRCGPDLTGNRPPQEAPGEAWGQPWLLSLALPLTCYVTWAYASTSLSHQPPGTWECATLPSPQAAVGSEVAQMVGKELCKLWRAGPHTTAVSLQTDEQVAASKSEGPPRPGPAAPLLPLQTRTVPSPMTSVWEKFEI